MEAEEFANDRSGARILVCAADPVILEDVGAALGREGWKYEATPHPDQAVARALRPEIAVVVADLALGSPAIDLVPSLRARRPAPAVILLAHASQRQTAARAMRLGAFAYVTKPIFPDEIAVQVERAFEWHGLTGRSDPHRAIPSNPRRSPTPALEGDEAGRLGAAWLLSVLELRGAETRDHVERIGRFAAAVGRTLGWIEEDGEVLRLAAALHDVGKIAIPDHILHKPDRLTTEEMDLVRRHTRLGAEILVPEVESPLLARAREIALCHHERWDGGGYPQRLAGEAIPPWARIVTVVDVYDALTHERAYRAALPEQVALSYMRFQRGRQFDPRVYDAFVESLPQIRKIRWQWDESLAA